MRIAPALRAALITVALVAGSSLAAAVGPLSAAESPSPGPSASSGTPTLSSSPSSPTPTPTLVPGAVSAIPVWAYYYIWFDPSSWERAKSDFPLLGRYSSDETAIMRKHIELAKSVGIDGFLVSWKDTPKLSSRLERLSRVAAENDFHLGLVYQGLDFARRPIEVRQVCADLQTFADEYAANPVFRLRGDKPVVIWTGTDQYSTADLEKCVAPVRDRLTVLASSRSTAQWQRVADIFEGSAYYWSSVNPEKAWYPRKLAEMGDAVRSTGGLWVAPAAPGFDARLVGGKTVVPRSGDRTLTLELQAALASAPDAIGLISWNEFTENSQVEPSRRYGTGALETLSKITGVGAPVPRLDSSAPAQEPAASGFNGVAAILIMAAILGGVLVWSRWRRDPAPPDVHGPRSTGHDDHDAAHGQGNGDGAPVRDPYDGEASDDGPAAGQAGGPQW